MTAEIIVGEWRKNQRETVRVRLDTYQGRAIADVRVWYDDGGGTLKPGRNGLTIAVQHLPELATCINRALELASAPVPEAEVARLRAEGLAALAHADALEAEGKGQEPG